MKIYNQIIENSNLSNRRSQREIVKLLDKDSKYYAIEAATGCGKTIAYLSKAIEEVEKNPDLQVIVSTSSKNLQNQIYKKDLPQILEILNLDLKFTLLKGKNNYACYKNINTNLYRGYINELDEVNGLISETSLNQLSEKEIKEIEVSEDNCIGIKKCMFRNNCWFLKERKKLKNAKIIILNHHLLSMYFLYQFHNFITIPENTLIIIDEAHKFIDIYKSLKNTKFSKYVLRDLENLFIKINQNNKYNEIISFLRKEKQIFDQQYKKIFEKYRIKEDSEILISKEDIKVYFNKKRIKSYISLFYPILDSIMSLIDITTDEILLSYLVKIKNKLLSLISFIYSVKKFLKTTKDEALENLIYFSLIKKKSFKRNQENIILSYSELACGKELRKIFDEFYKNIFTSATLFPSKNNVEFFLNELNLKRNECVYDIILSDFNYAKQCKIYVFKHKDNLTFFENSKEIIKKINTFNEKVFIPEYDGNGLVLFTSLKNMKEASIKIEDKISDKINFFSQSFENKELILQKCEQLQKENKRYLIYGSSSFFEGIDLQLQMVMLTSLPFSAVTSPEIIVRKNWFEKNGKNFFMQYYLLKCIITLKQMLGRLIRNENSKGIIVSFDDRLITKRYSKVILNSLLQYKKKNLYIF